MRSFSNARALNKYLLVMMAISQTLGKTLLKIGACICIGLGVIGAFLPVLPTTPFLILATVLSYNSSPRIRSWLLNHPIFGETIQNYLEERTITVKALRSALIMLWLCLLVSFWFVQNVWVDIFLFITGALVSVYLLQLPRKR